MREGPYQPVGLSVRMGPCRKSLDLARVTAPLHCLAWNSTDSGNSYLQSKLVQIIIDINNHRKIEPHEKRSASAVYLPLHCHVERSAVLWPPTSLTRTGPASDSTADELVLILIVSDVSFLSKSTTKKNKKKNGSGRPSSVPPPFKTGGLTGYACGIWKVKNNYGSSRILS